MAALNTKLAAISDNAAVLTSELLKKTEESQQLKVMFRMHWFINTYIQK